MKVTILDAYIPSDLEKSNPDLYAENVRKYMAEEANVVTTEHSYDDMLLQQEILNLVSKEFYYLPDFEMSVVKELFELDLEHCKLLCTRFGELVSDHKTGHMTFNDFVLAFGFNTGDYNEDFSRLVFSFFDTSDSGAIEFREFLQALALVDRKSSDLVNKSKLAYMLFISDGKMNLQNLNASIALITKNTDGNVVPVAPVTDVQFNEYADHGVMNLSEFESFAVKNERVIDVAVNFVKSKFGISFEEARVNATKKKASDNNI